MAGRNKKYEVCFNLQFEIEAVNEEKAWKKAERKIRPNVRASIKDKTLKLIG